MLQTTGRRHQNDSNPGRESQRDAYGEWSCLLPWLDPGRGSRPDPMGFNRRGALMPKRKPDELIEYRISLQDKERELLDQVSTAYSVNKIATPLVNLLSDASAMSLVIIFLYSSFQQVGRYGRC